MTVILSASDETSLDKFVYAGLLAPVKYWENIFAPRWERMVLGGSPKIPFFHMTDIRSSKWRESVGMSYSDAERRIDDAVHILCKRKDPTWAGFGFSRATFHEHVKQKFVIPTTGAVKDYHPDYFGFIGYVFAVLKFVKVMYPDVKKVDFLVERSGEVTRKRWKWLKSN